MSQNSWKRNQWVEPSKGVQITSAEAHHANFQEYLLIRDDRLRNLLDRNLPWFQKHKCFHIKTTLVSINSSSHGAAIEISFPVYSTVLSGWVAPPPEPCPADTHMILNCILAGISG